MDGFRAYKYYIATKLHFTNDKFNVFENPNVKGSRDAFFNRNDRYIFEKLARKFTSDHDLIQYYVANFAYGNDAVAYHDSESDTNLTVWTKRKQSITRIFENDLSAIILHLEKEKKGKAELFTFDDNNFPELFKLYLGHYVTIESLSILNNFQPYLLSWRRNANLIWDEECRRIEKVKGFVKYDEYKLTPVYTKFLEDLSELTNGTHVQER